MSLSQRNALLRCARVLLPAALLAAWCGAAARGAELRLRGECTAAGALVRLDDVAEIVAADAAEAGRLAELELFPAPVHPGQRFLTVRELEDLLLLRGINPARHSISGSSQVVIHGRRDGRDPGPALPGSAARKARERVEQAVRQYLDQHAAQPTAWQLDFELGEHELRRLWPPVGQITARGGRPPWTGPQMFEVQVDSPAGREMLRLQVDVQTAPAVVVTTRSLSRGTIIRPSDVSLQSGLAPEDSQECFHSLEQVVEHETTRALPAGVVLQRASVRAPLLVRRGEVVTVYSRAAGICVRTTARARDEGAMGELVEVESLWARETYFARVCGIQEVEVFARPPQATTAPPQAQAQTAVLPATSAGPAAPFTSGAGSGHGPVQAGALQGGGHSVEAMPGGVEALSGATSAAPVANRPLRAPAAVGSGF